MAEISASLNVINNISNSLSVIQEKTYNIIPTIKQAFDVSIVQNMNHNLYQTTNNMLNIENMVVNVCGELEKTEKQTEKAAKKGDLLSNAYKKVSSMVKNIDIENVLNKSDELTRTMTQLNNVNDGSQSSSELFDMIYASAKNAHAPLMSTVDAITTMGNSTGDLFGSNQELVDFMNQVNKQFAIGGASATEQSSAIEQLSQSMASGVIKGSEMNKILEAVPGIASTIEKNMGWAEGSLMSYAEQGKVTSEVVKASVLNMSDETNEAFENIPLTYSDVMTNLQSDATKIFQPVLQRINDVFNSDIFQSFLVGVTTAMSVGANIMITVFDLIGSVAGWIYDNWSMIEPVIHGVIAALAIYIGYLGIMKVAEMVGNAIKAISCLASLAHAAATKEEADKTLKATAAQYGFNSALLASPLTWFVIILALVIAAVVAFANWIAKTTGVAETGFGVICGWINVVIQWFKNLGIMVVNTFFGIISAISAVGDNISIAFGNAISGVKALFFDLLSTALTVIAEIAEGLNKLPFVEFDFSGITAKAEEFAVKAKVEAENIKKFGDVGEAFDTGYKESGLIAFEDGWKEDAMSRGVAWGDDKMNKFTSGIEEFKYNSGEYDFGLSGTTEADIAATADNTASLNDSVDISNENLKYLKDVAERDAINRFTTAQIKVNMNNNNNISNGMDLDGVINYLTAGVTEAMGQAAEGVHA